MYRKQFTLDPNHTKIQPPKPTTVMKNEIIVCRMLCKKESINELIELHEWIFAYIFEFVLLIRKFSAHESAHCVTVVKRVERLQLVLNNMHYSKLFVGQSISIIVLYFCCYVSAVIANRLEML